MKPSDFVSISDQRRDMSQFLLQMEMTDAINTSIMDRAGKSEKSLKSGLYSVDKKTSTGGAASAVLAIIASKHKGKVDADGKAGAVASVLANGATYRLLEGSELEGADDACRTVKGASRAAKAIGNKLNGKGSPNLEGSLKSTGKTAGRGTINNALEGSELKGTDTFYNIGKTTYHTVCRIKKRLSGEDTLSLEESLDELSEKKSAKRGTSVIEAERKTQASAYFKQKAHPAVEEAKTAATAAKGSVSVTRDTVQELTISLGVVTAPVLGIIIVFILAIILITVAISGDDGDNSNFGNLSGVQLEVAQALSDAGLDNPQIAAVMGNVSGESGWNLIAEYHGADGEYGFGLFQFTDTPAQNVHNCTVFANWCSINNKDKNSAAVQTEYFMTRLPTSWNITLHRAGYYYSTAPQYSGMDASYEAWLSTSDVSSTTYRSIACHGRLVVWAAKGSFPNAWPPAAQSLYEQLMSDGGQDRNVSDATQKAIVDAAKRIPSPGAGYYATWVSNAYENAGFSCPGGNACCQYLGFCTGTNRSQLKTDMVIGVQRSPINNSNWCGGHLGYGHVGAYIGDDKVMENVGYTATTDLDSWIAYNGQLSQPRWGLPPGVH